MGVRVVHSIGDLGRDLTKMAATAPAKLAEVVASNARKGMRLAREFATVSAGSHGKHYPDSITVESHGSLSWEYGPDPGRPQGGMSFEFGSRNQKPHLDLARSADIVGPSMADDVGDVLDDLFWPGA
jgi:hypothetical protein